MAEQDFYGTWQINDTSGTPFGIGTTIAIAENGTDLASPKVDFDPPVSGFTNKVTTYHPELDALQIDAESTVDPFESISIMVARYEDDLDPEFRAIYGHAVIVLSDGRARTAVLMATQAMSGEGAGLDSNPSIEGLDDAATYIVGTTAGAQFGKGSRVTITDDGSSYIVEIVNALGSIVPAPPLFFDENVCALKGIIPASDDDPQVALQLSWYDRTDPNGVTARFVYGLSVVGDPEEAGAWGGDDEDTTPQGQGGSGLGGGS